MLSTPNPSGLDLNIPVSSLKFPNNTQVIVDESDNMFIDKALQACIL
jgi:hypothetical protein